MSVIDIRDYLGSSSEIHKAAFGVLTDQWQPFDAIKGHIPANTEDAALETLVELDLAGIAEMQTRTPSPISQIPAGCVYYFRVPQPKL